MHTLRTSRLALVALCLLSAASFAGAADAPPATKPAVNPEFTNWSKFKPGSTRTAVSVSPGPAGMKMSSTFVETLVAVDKDSVTVNAETTMQMGDQPPMKSPADKRVIRAALDASTSYATVGKEELTVDGKKLACTVLDKTMSFGEMKMVQKTWWSDAVPGGVVKTHQKMGAEEVTTTLTKFEAK